MSLVNTRHLSEVEECDVLLFDQGAGRAFSAGGDLKMFYEGKSGTRNYIAQKQITHVNLSKRFLSPSICTSMQ